MTLRLTVREQRLVTHASEVILSASSFRDEGAWHCAVMEAVMPLTGSYKSAIRVATPRGFQMTPTAFEESAIEEHKAYYCKFDFGRALGDKPRLPAVFSRNEYYREDFSRFRKTEYYVDYLTRYAVFDALCLSNRDDDPSRGAVLYLWHVRELASDVRQKGLAILRLLAPSFKAGIAAAQQFHSRNADLSLVFEKSSDGIILLDQNLITLHSNPAFQVIITEAGDRTALMTGVMECAGAVRDTCRKQNGSVAEMHAVSRTVHCGRMRYTISGCLSRAGSGDSMSILVSVTPTGPRTLDGIKTADLRETFSLTRREIEVALLLRSRQTNQEIAAKLGISDHTTRHHTENVLRKLCVETRKGVADVLSQFGLEHFSVDRPSAGTKP